MDRQLQALFTVSQQGSVLWSYKLRYGDTLENIAADSNAVYLNANSTDVIALDLDGRGQWIVNARTVNRIEIGDDGTLYLLGYDQIGVLRP